MKKIRKTYSGVVPNGKVLNSRNDSQQDTYSSDYLNRIIPDTNDLGEIVVDDIKCKNLLPTQPSGWEQGTFNTSTNIGAEVSSTTRLRTVDFIQIKSNTSYYISIQNKDYSFLNIFYYDSDKNYVTQAYVNYPNINGSTSLAITTPANIAFARVVLKNSDDSSVITSDEVTNIKPMIEKGSVATDYVEHKEFENKEVYSTSEQRIGTWVDGKPLYRKVIRTTTASAINTTKTLDTIANLQEITKSNSSWKTTDGFKYFTDNPSEAPVIFVDTSNNVTESHKADYFNNATIVIVLEYTKTTD